MWIEYCPKCVSCPNLAYILRDGDQRGGFEVECWRSRPKDFGFDAGLGLNLFSPLFNLDYLCLYVHEITMKYCSNII